MKGISVALPHKHLGLLWAPTSHYKSKPLILLGILRTVKRSNISPWLLMDLKISMKKGGTLILLFKKSMCLNVMTGNPDLSFLQLWAPKEWPKTLDLFRMKNTAIMQNLSCWWCTILKIFVIKREPIHMHYGFLWVPQARSKPLIRFGRLNFSCLCCTILDIFVIKHEPIDMH